MQKNNKILIFGKGQIGNMYYNYFSKKDYKVNLTGVDITNIKKVHQRVNLFKPNVVINCAAKTNLEWCEANKLHAFNVNVLGANNIASVCQEKDIHFIHLSSGCIFESKSPQDAKREEDKPSPAAFYSWTKVWAENLITSKKNLRYLILRPRQPVSSEVSEKNMLIKMLTFKMFVGENGGWNSGTVLEDMMGITEKMISKQITGIFHVANMGWTTPYKIAVLLKKHINPQMKFKKISHAQLDKITPTKRVATVLNVDKLKTIGITPENYEKRLEETIILLRDNLKKPKSKKILENTLLTSKQRTQTSVDWAHIFD